MNAIASTIQPAISHFDIEVVGTTISGFYSYRRVVEDKDTIDPTSTTIRALAPDEPAVEGQLWAVYKWDVEREQWDWVADCVDESTAQQLAMTLAGVV